MLPWKRKSITYSECVSVALVIQNAKRMRRVILSSVACLAVQKISTLSYFFLQHSPATILILKEFDEILS